MSLSSDAPREIAPDSNPQRLESIDLLRGVAVLSVFFFHLANHVPDISWLRPFGSLGFLGVNLFLVISGFCIHTRLASRSDGSLQVGFLKFWQRRLGRLYPAYVCAIFFSILIACLLTKARFNHFWPPARFPNQEVIWLDTICHLLFLHIFVPTMLFGLYNPPLWSLALEEQLYLMYWPFLWLRRRFSSARIVGIAVAVAMIWRASVFFNPWYPGIDHYPILGSPAKADDLPYVILMIQAPARWAEWCLGALAAELHFRQAKAPNWCSNAGIGFLIFCVGCCCFAWRETVILGDLVSGLAFFILINAACRHERTFFKSSSWLPVRILSWIGLWSYSLYLVHSPLLLGFDGLLSFVGSTSPVVRLSTMAFGTLLSAWIFYRLIERPTVTAFRKWTRQH
jgi:peptidoglycan/LPS O-acetylase OafA/YrhL